MTVYNPPDLSNVETSLTSIDGKIDGPLDMIMDHSTDSPNKFIGHAVIGSPTSSSVWRIKKLMFNDDGEYVGKGWADSVATFTKEWDDRDTYTYSQEEA